MENVVIVGGGIAGYTAAIYTARTGLNPLVITGYEEGGQLMLTTEVENFPGFPEGVQGPDLVQRTKKQAEKFGARIVLDQVDSIVKKDGVFLLRGVEKEYSARSVIIATGASARWLGVKGEDTYKGRGVSVCATCDGAFYKDKVVFVVGGGDAACEEALTLTRFASKVYLVHRRDELRASKIMQDRVLNHPKIELVWSYVVDEILGDGSKVEGVRLKSTKTGEFKVVKGDGVFVAIGHVPNTKMVEGLVELDERGYLVTDDRCRTNVEGLFGAGDVQDSRYQQAVTAAGSGCKAALEVEKFLEG